VNGSLLSAGLRKVPEPILQKCRPGYRLIFMSGLVGWDTCGAYAWPAEENWPNDTVIHMVLVDYQNGAYTSWFTFFSFKLLTILLFFFFWIFLITHCIILSWQNYPCIKFNFQKASSFFLGYTPKSIFRLFFFNQIYPFYARFQRKFEANKVSKLCSLIDYVFLVIDSLILNFF